MPRVEPTLLAAYIRRISPAEALTDAELVGRYAEHRNAAAFEVLVWRHSPMVWATCRRILRHQQDVEDAFQATFLALTRAAGSLGSRQAVAGWLHRVAANTALKLRADRITTGLPVEVPSRPESGDVELAGAVDEELDRLSNRVRAVFVLCCLEGMTNTEAARELGCPVGTINSRLHAARAQLRDRLTRRGFGPHALAGIVVTAAPPAALVAAAVRVSGGASATPVVAALGSHAVRLMKHGALTMKSTFCAVLVLAGMVWVFGSGPSGIPKPDPVSAAPPAVVAVPPSPVVIWRDGHPIAITPGTKRTTSLGTGFEGKRGAIRVGPDGKFLVYISNRDGVRPSDREKWDRVYVQRGTETKEIAIGEGSLCRAFWGSDGAVYDHDLAVPERKRGDGPADPPVDLTKDFVNWSFHPPTGARKRLKLPGNVSVLDRSPDGKSFLVLWYELPATLVKGAPGAWADYRLGTMPADGGDLVPLTKLGESTSSELRYSPDGRSVLGTMYRTAGDRVVPELVVFDLKSKARTAVKVARDAHVHASCWSPDGKKIAFVWESEAAYTERMNRFGPVDPKKEKKPVYTVTVASPDGSDARDLYTESEYSYGSIDWAVVWPGKGELGMVLQDGEPAVAEHIKALRDANSETRLTAATNALPSQRSEISNGTPVTSPRAILYPDKPGPTLIVGRLTVNNHAMKQDCQVFSVGVEVDNLTARAAILEFDPKDLKLELLDADGKIIAESLTARSGPAPMTHKATLPTSGYVGISTYRGGIGLTPKSILLAAGLQDWVLKPGTYMVRGTVTVSVTFGGEVLDPEKPDVPESKPKNAPHKLKLELIACRFELKREQNAPDH
jgi:RNA polymerase sigma factor (sigma-70 family)